MVLWRHILKKFSTNFDLVAEFSKFLKTLINNQNCKLAVAAKSVKRQIFFSSFPLNEKFSGLCGLSGLVPRVGHRTTFFYVLNASFFCILLNHATFFYVLFSSFWRLMRPKRTMRSFAKDVKERRERFVL